jgi:Amt family ammonium transporter|nr:ammonium transporter [Acidiferrobacter sp.]
MRNLPFVIKRAAVGLLLTLLFLIPLRAYAAQPVATAGTAGAQPVAMVHPARPPTAVHAHISRGDTAWMMTATVLVLMMTIPGLALFYGGMVRDKNVLSTLAHSFATTCLVTLLWYFVGYSLSFSGGNAFIGGFGRLFLHGMGRDTVIRRSMAIPESVYMSFQMTFAIITPALISGSFAERIKFSAVLWFSALWLLCVYAPVVHWIWSPRGWLAHMGVLDFAGGTVVEVNSGVAGLITALVVGRRVGYRREAMAPHNLVLTILGASLLWVGWFGFNAGSAVSSGGLAGMAMATTQIATAAAAMTWMFAEWSARGKPSVLGMASGAVAGAVAITPASGFVDPSGALLIGIAGGGACFWAVTYLKNKLGYDDSLDVFGVHGVGGAIGLILTGIFAVKAIGGTAGALEGNIAQIGKQAIAIGAVAAYDAVLTFIILKLVDLVIGLRPTTEEEREGLDITQHGERAYSE